MNDALFERRLNELIYEIGGVPNPHQKQQKKSVDNLQESLDYLRISIKYLIFDLEATRRENAHLKKLLKNRDSI